MRLSLVHDLATINANSNEKELSSYKRRGQFCAAVGGKGESSIRTVTSIIQSSNEEITPLGLCSLKSYCCCCCNKSIGQMKRQQTLLVGGGGL